MATRKGKGRQAVRNGSSGFPGWGYAVIGIVIGGVLTAVMLHSSLPKSPNGPQANPQATAQHASEAGALEPAGSDGARALHVVAAA